MQNMLAIIIFFHFFSMESADDAMDAVTTLVSKMETLTAPTADVLVKVEKLSEQSALLIKTAFPVASLVLAGLSIASQTESPEYKALKKLTESMDRQFRQLTRTVSFSMNVINLEAKLLNYQSHVTRFLPRLQRETIRMTNPAKNKTEEDVIEFVQEVCQNIDLDPQMILDYIWVAVISDCNSASDETDAKLLAKIYQAIRSAKIKKRKMPEADIIEMQLKSADIIGKLAKYGYENASDIFDKVSGQIMNRAHRNSVNNKIFQSPLQLLDLLYSKLEENEYTSSEFTTESRNGCLLMEIIRAKLFHRQPVEQMANLIKTHAVFLEYFATICAQFRWRHKPVEKIYEYTNLTAGIVANISAFMIEWIPKKLNTSFPEFEKEQIIMYLDSLGEVEIAENVKIYSELASNISKLISPIGNSNYQRQLLITPERSVDLDYTTVCPEKWYGTFISLKIKIIFMCITITGRIGINLLWTRFDVDEEFRATGAEQWAVSVREKIFQVVDREKGTDSVKRLRESIEQTLGYNLTSYENYRSMAIFRFHTRGYANCIDEAFYLNGFEIETVKTTYNTSYFFYDHYTKDCEMFHFVYTL